MADKSAKSSLGGPTNLAHPHLSVYYGRVASGFAMAIIALLVLSLFCCTSSTCWAAEEKSNQSQTPADLSNYDFKGTNWTGVIHPNFGRNTGVPIAPSGDDVTDMERYLDFADPDWKEGNPIVQNRIPSTDQDFINIIRKSTEALKVNPKDAGAYIDLAYANRNLNNFSAALKYSTKGIELDPNIAVAYAERALNLYNLNQNSDALNDLKRAIELDPNNSAFYSHLGWIYIDEHDYKKAVEECSRSIKIYAGYSPAFYCRGIAHLQLKDYKNAVADLTEAVKLFPHEVSGYYVSRAKAYLHLKDYDAALSDLRTALDMDGIKFRDRVSRTLLGKSFGQSDELTDLCSALRQKPSPDSDLLCLGLLRRLMKDDENGVDDALKTFDRAIKLAPQNGEIYRARGYFYSRIKKDYEKGICDLTKAIELNPKDSLAYRYRGLSYIESKDFERAILDFNTVIRLNPTDSQAYLLRAGAYNSTGQSAKVLADRKASFEVLINNFSLANVPSPQDFDRILQRDLDKQMSHKLGKPVRVSYRLLNQTPTKTNSTIPNFYCWVKMFDDDKSIEDGAVRVVAAQKRFFFITDYLRSSDIEKDPMWVFEIFPESLRDDVFESAGIESPPKAVTINRIPPGSFKTFPIENGVVKIQWRDMGTNIVNEKTLPVEETREFIESLKRKFRRVGVPIPDSLPSP